MNIRKSLIAAIAAAALVGALAFTGTASAATTLCSTNTSPCTGTAYSIGAKLEGKLKAGTEAELKAGFSNVRCKRSEFAGKVEDFSSPGEAPTGNLSALAVSECGSCTVTVLKAGSVEITAESGGNGTLISSNAETTFTCSGVSCIFGTSSEGTILGKVMGGNPAVLVASVKMSYREGDSGNSVCTLGVGTAKWTAEYEFTNPKPMFAVVGKSPIGTTLCSTNTSPCTGTAYSIGAKLEGKLKAGTEARLNAGFAIVKCKKTEFAGKVEDFSSPGEAPTGNLSALTFGECGSCEVTVLKKGSLEITSESGGNGTLVSSSAETTINCSGVSCKFGTAVAGTSLGPVSGGNPATLSANAKLQWQEGDSSNSVCTFGTGTATWTAEYEFTNPKPLFVVVGATPTATLCSTNTSPCEGTTYGEETEIVSKLVAGTEAVLEAGFATVKCKNSESAWRVKDSTAGGGPTGNVSSISYTSCSCEVNVLANGSVELRRETGSPTGNGTWLGKGNELTFKCGAVSCKFATPSEGMALGNVTGGNPAVLKVSAELPWKEGDASSSTCTGGSGVAKWTAEYEITAPKPLFIE